jgi:hypothetical protein
MEDVQELAGAGPDQFRVGGGAEEGQGFGGDNLIVKAITKAIRSLGDGLSIRTPPPKP